MLGPFALMSRLSPRRHAGGRSLQHGRGARALKQQGGCQIAALPAKRTGERPRDKCGGENRVEAGFGTLASRELGTRRA
jgi:hypothetical protein